MGKILGYIIGIPLVLIVLAVMEGLFLLVLVVVFGMEDIPLVPVVIIYGLLLLQFIINHFTM